MGVKSTSPISKATIYPTKIPPKTGINLNIFLPKTTSPIATANDIIARIQFSLAISIPVGANAKPMHIITGPMTIAGKYFSISLIPFLRTIIDTITYIAPAAINPPNAPGKPYSSIPPTIGAINAKLLPRKTGTLLFVTRWKIRVPPPAVNNATAGSNPVSKGTSTVAPNATKSI